MKKKINITKQFISAVTLIVLLGFVSTVHAKTPYLRSSVVVTKTIIGDSVRITKTTQWPTMIIGNERYIVHLIKENGKPDKLAVTIELTHCCDYKSIVYDLKKNCDFAEMIFQNGELTFCSKDLHIEDEVAVLSISEQH